MPDRLGYGDDGKVKVGSETMASGVPGWNADDNHRAMSLCRIPGDPSVVLTGLKDQGPCG